MRGLSGSAAVNSNQGTGSVESFFQIDNNGRVPAASYTSNNKTASRLLSEFNSPEPTKSAAGAPFRFLWHVMDNAGVPMFFGKSDDDLDPSLRLGYRSQGAFRGGDGAGLEAGGPSRLGSRRSVDTTTRHSVDTATTRRSVDATENRAVAPHKIPESELEGTDSWVKDNDQMP